MTLFPLNSIIRRSLNNNCFPVHASFPARNGAQFLTAFFLIPFFAFIFQGCKTLEMGKGEKEFTNINSVIDGIEANNPDYEWLNGKLRMKVSTPSNNMSGNGNLKMKKDEVIWLSISPGLGLEVMRAKITPDSLHILNRMEQKYTASSFEKVNRFFPSKDLTFKNLQNLLLGQPAFEVTSGYKLKADTSTVQLTQEDRVWKTMLTLFQGNLKMQNLDLSKPATDQSLNIQYQDYQKTGDYWLPGQMNMEARTPERMQLEIQFKEFNFKAEDQAAFNIPSSYERTQ